MIERKRDRRLLKNGNQRFGQILRQRPQSRPHTSGQDERLRNVVHRRKSKFLELARNDSAQLAVARYLKYRVRVPKSIMPWCRLSVSAPKRPATGGEPWSNPS